MVKFYLLLLIFYPITLLAQSVKVEGSVRDTQEEPLPFANILILPDSLMTACGSDGKFSISL